MTFTIFSDGGARGNPGPAASAFVVYDQTKNVVAKQSTYLGKTTNNIAEYWGVLSSFRWLLANDAISTTETEVNFFLDSQLVVMQLSGLYKIKNDTLKNLASEIKSCELSFLKVTYKHIPREQNLIADQLVNECLDKET